VSDARCEECAEAVERTVETILLPFPVLDAEVMDWSDPAAKEIAAAAGVDLLPAYIFPEGVKASAGFAAIEEFTYDSGGWTVVRPDAVGADFDPTAEICAGGTDEDGDGKVDCDDPSCEGAPPCRPEVPKALDIFVMALCPFASDALHAAYDVYHHFGGKLTIRVHWISTVMTQEEAQALGSPEECVEAGERAFCSLHGAEEVGAGLAQICAQSLSAPEKFMALERCMTGGGKTGMDFSECGEAAGVDLEGIGKCAAGAAGADLLAADAALADSLGVDASPSYLWNNTLVEYVEPSAASIAAKACEMNGDLAGCADLSGLQGAKAAGKGKAGAGDGQCQGE
jgi:hypothetical protein